MLGCKAQKPHKLLKTNLKNNFLLNFSINIFNPSSYMFFLLPTLNYSTTLPGIKSPENFAPLPQHLRCASGRNSINFFLLLAQKSGDEDRGCRPTPHTGTNDRNLLRFMESNKILRGKKRTSVRLGNDVHSRQDLSSVLELSDWTIKSISGICKMAGILTQFKYAYAHFCSAKRGHING